MIKINKGIKKMRIFIMDYIESSNLFPVMTKNCEIKLVLVVEKVRKIK